MDTTPLTRRHLLALIGITSAAGCVDSLPFISPGVPLGDMSVSNATDEPQSIHIHLHRGGEKIYEDIIEVSENDYEMIDSTWSSEPAKYTLEYTTDDKSSELSLPEDTNIDNCNYVIIAFNEYVGVEAQLYDDPPTDEFTC